VGIDVLSVARIARVHRRHGKRFVARLLHPAEREEFGKARHKVRYLAKCFAAKEAFVKALGTGFIGVAHDDVGVVRGELGKPDFVYSARLRARLKRLKISGAHVSISDEGDTVGAVAVLERGK
jgi:holo-[acyl-carrier protein] synthase